jgi:hypothetical protein
MKTTASIALIALLSFLGVGCAGTIAQQQATESRKIVQRSPADIQAHSVVEKDPYAGTFSVRSPRLDYSGSTVTLLYTQPKGAAVGLYSVGINQYGTDWLFLSEAFDSTGRKLKFTVLDRQVFRGGITELVAVDFTRADLDKAITTGIDFKMYGQRGNVEVYVPKNYVTGFLAAVDAAKK